MKDLLVTRSSMPPFEEYVEAIRHLWDDHWLTNMGPMHEELEARLAEHLDVDHLSLAVNGHMALELIIASFGFPRGSEVITTPFTFVSTTHAIARSGLVPVFCDVKISDGTIDPSKIRSLITSKTVAILPVHVYGNVCDDEAIGAIAAEHGLKVIYDAAHAFGVRYRGRGVGRLGDASMFSFHATKAYNTIEGGAAVFKDPSVRARFVQLRSFGTSPNGDVMEIGANAKMNEFCAAMGLCNLRRAKEAFDARARVYAMYMKGLMDIEWVRLLGPQGDQTLAHAYLPIIIEENSPMTRDELCNLMRSRGIYPRKYFWPLTSDMPCYADIEKRTSLDAARYLSERVLAMPFYEGMTESDVDRCVSAFRRERG